MARYEASKTIEAITREVTGALKRGQRLTLVSFGTFATTWRKARTGRNPQTGELIRNADRRVPRFILGRALKVAVR